MNNVVLNSVFYPILVLVHLVLIALVAIMNVKTDVDSDKTYIELLELSDDSVNNDFYKSETLKIFVYTSLGLVVLLLVMFLLMNKYNNNIVEGLNSLLCVGVLALGCCLVASGVELQKNLDDSDNSSNSKDNDMVKAISACVLTSGSLMILLSIVGMMLVGRDMPIKKKSSQNQVKPPVRR